MRPTAYPIPKGHYDKLASLKNDIVRVINLVPNPPDDSVAAVVGIGAKSLTSHTVMAKLDELLTRDFEPIGDK